MPLCFVNHNMFIKENRNWENNFCQLVTIEFIKKLYEMQKQMTEEKKMLIQKKEQARIKRNILHHVLQDITARIMRENNEGKCTTLH